MSYTLHVVAVLVPTVQTCILLGYYINALVLNNPTYVSDLLFTDPVYIVIITACVMIQFIVCIAYVWLHITSPSGRCLEATFLLTACVGWFMLCLRYLDEGGTYIDSLHTAGIAVFVVGCAAYFTRMLVCMVSIAYSSSQKVVTLVYVVVALLLVSAVCLAAFIYFYYRNGGRLSDSPAWLFEHPSFAAFALAHAVFFEVDWKQEEEEKKKKDVGDPAAIRMYKNQPRNEDTDASRHVAGLGEED